MEFAVPRVRPWGPSPSRSPSPGGRGARKCEDLPLLSPENGDRGGEDSRDELRERCASHSITSMHRRSGNKPARGSGNQHGAQVASTHYPDQRVEGGSLAALSGCQRSGRPLSPAAKGLADRAPWLPVLRQVARPGCQRSGRSRAPAASAPAGSARAFTGSRQAQNACAASRGSAKLAFAPPTNRGGTPGRICA